MNQTKKACSICGVHLRKKGTVCSISEWLRAEFKLDVCPNGPININVCLHLLFAMRVPLFLFNLHKCNCCGQIPQEHPSRICEHVIPYYPIYPYCQLRFREKTHPCPVCFWAWFPVNPILSATKQSSWWSGSSSTGAKGLVGYHHTNSPSCDTFTGKKFRLCCEGFVSSLRRIDHASCIRSKCIQPIKSLHSPTVPLHEILECLLITPKFPLCNVLYSHHSSAHLRVDDQLALFI